MHAILSKASRTPIAAGDLRTFLQDRAARVSGRHRLGDASKHCGDGVTVTLQVPYSRRMLYFPSVLTTGEVLPYNGPMDSV